MSEVAAIYIVVFAALVVFWASGELEAHDAVWWPLALLKFLVRTLWRSLTTGWKP